MNRLLLCAALLVALPSHANDRPTSERVVDGLAFGGGAAAGALAAGYAGLHVGAALCDKEAADPDDLFACLGPSLLGAGVGGLAGFIGGGLLYDGLSDGDGSLWAAAAGGGAGLAIGVGLLKFVEIDQDLLVWGAAFALTVGGAGAGYALYDSDAAPAVAIMPDGAGGVRYATALSGSF